MEFRSIVSSLILKDEKSEQVYHFRTGKLTVESDEPVDWVLDGEFGGRRTEVSVENIHCGLSIRRSFR